MKKLFSGLVVMITGASSGFGAETARHFAKEGAKLVLIARRNEKLNELAKEIKEKYHSEIVTLLLDVTVADQVTTKLNSLKAPFSTPDILVNNAGLVKGMDKLWEIDPKDWDVMIDTNVKGVLNMTRYILPKMIEANQGHIINVSSTSSYGTYPGGGVYCATKFAVRAITDTLRMELVASPIRVSMISPGMAKTEFSLVRFNGDLEKAEHVYKGMEPLTAEDIAEGIIFMASRPPHVNVADMIIYPKQQASPNIIHKK